MVANTQNENEIMTSEEAAAMLRIPIDSLYRLCRMKQVPYKKCGKWFRFTRTSLKAWLEEK